MDSAGEALVVEADRKPMVNSEDAEEDAEEYLEVKFFGLKFVG